MDEAAITERLEFLRIEHHDLDAAIDALRQTGSSDQLQIARMKKRKLLLRDEIAQLEDRLGHDEASEAEHEAMLSRYSELQEAFRVPCVAWSFE